MTVFVQKGIFAALRWPRRPMCNLALAATLGAFSTPTAAQVDPAQKPTPNSTTQSAGEIVKSAKASGTVGEGWQGFPMVVADAEPLVRSAVIDLAMKRKAAYQRVVERGESKFLRLAIIAFDGRLDLTYATLGEVFGCKLVSDTVPGEKYYTYSGVWKTRTSASPDLAPHCLALIKHFGSIDAAFA